MAYAVGPVVCALTFGLSIGIAGYAGFEGMSLTDAFLNAAMILSGMGPAAELKTRGRQGVRRFLRDLLRPRHRHRHRLRAGTDLPSRAAQVPRRDAATTSVAADFWRTSQWGTSAGTPDLPAAEAAIIEMTNAFRAENKLAPVRQNPTADGGGARLCQEADRFGRCRTRPTARRRRSASPAGYRYCQVGENLASILDTRGFIAGEYARRAVQGWETPPATART